MTLTLGGRAPYAPSTAILTIVAKHRQVGLRQVDVAILQRIGITEALAPRTLASVKLLGLYDDDGEITPEFDNLKRVPEEELRPRLGELLSAAYAPVLEILGDPAQASRQDMANAFRGFEPTSQLDRMVLLFVGLMTFVGMMPEDITRKPGPKTGSAGTPRTSKSSGSKSGAGSKLGAAQSKGTTPATVKHAPVDPPTVTSDLRREYFDLLVAKAKESDGTDADLLDRIERLLDTTPPKPTG